MVDYQDEISEQGKWREGSYFPLNWEDIRDEFWVLLCWLAKLFADIGWALKGLFVLLKLEDTSKEKEALVSVLKSWISVESNGSMSESESLFFNSSSFSSNPILIPWVLF